MRIRIINEELSNFNHDYKVKNMNYDMVVFEENNESLPINMDDVELIPENKYEELISKYKDILKVRLGNSISTALYAALIDCIEDRINGTLEGLDVLKDEYKISKRGIWEKKLIIVVNDYIPLDITVIGQKYSKEFSITFKDIILKDFINGCCEDMKCLAKEIEEKQKNINIYKKILGKVIGNSALHINAEPKRIVSGG